MGHVDGSTPCSLCDLFAAAESVCDDQRFGRRVPHGRQEYEFPHLHRDIVMIAFEAEASGHSTTS